MCLGTAVLKCVALDVIEKLTGPEGATVSPALLALYVALRTLVCDATDAGASPRFARLVQFDLSLPSPSLGPLAAVGLVRESPVSQKQTTAVEVIFSMTESQTLCTMDEVWV